AFVFLWCASAVAAAQMPSPDDPQPIHEHHMSDAWSIAVDGALFATLDAQGGPRGDTVFTSQNWLMVMGSKPIGPGTLALTGMFSGGPATVGQPGYRELFQEGEAYRGLQITDRQHPHDLFMQLTAAWRQPLGDRAALTIEGGPVGEAALGPEAFMHR